MDAVTPQPHSASPARAPGAGFTIRLYEDGATAAQVDLGEPSAPSSILRQNRNQASNDAEALALDEEIAFRQAPVFEEPAGPPMQLPANLIEFPRQLVAPRKARPRYAEGPLREEAGDPPGGAQLRIFEVDPAQISTSPAVDTAAPQWTSIWLDSAPVPAPFGGDGAGAISHHRSATEAAQNAVESANRVAFPQTASIGRRMLAAAVNACIVLSGLLAFAVAFVLVSDHSIQWQAGASLHATLSRIAGSLAAHTGLQPGMLPAIGAVAGGFLFLLYHALFFSLSSATPGMRCARIALCTFDDANPTRPAMQRRILAVLLSTCPLGLGLLWAVLDEDRLAWHDRISRIYQRSY